jgi:hypothetical protein
MALEIRISPATPMLVIAAMTEIANHAGNEPWPPLESASKWFDRASIALAISLLLGFASTVVIIWLGIVKEHHWELARERANEKIAAVNEETARLSVEAETARKETAQAKLELQKIRFPRSLDIEKFRAGIEGLQSGSFEVLFDPASPDAYSLAFTISVALRMSLWDTPQIGPMPVTPVPPPESLLPAIRQHFLTLPLTMRAGGSSWGVAIVTNDEPDLEKNKLGSTFVDALLHSIAGPDSVVHLGKAFDKLPDGRIRIVVAPKLP